MLVLCSPDRCLMSRSLLLIEQRVVIITLQDEMRKEWLNLLLMVYISPNGKVVQCCVLMLYCAVLIRALLGTFLDNYLSGFLTKWLLFFQVVLPSIADDIRWNHVREWPLCHVCWRLREPPHKQILRSVDWRSNWMTFHFLTIYQNKLAFSEPSYSFSTSCCCSPCQEKQFSKRSSQLIWTLDSWPNYHSI